MNTCINSSLKRRALPTSSANRIDIIIDLLNDPELESAGPQSWTWHPSPSPESRPLQLTNSHILSLCFFCGMNLNSESLMSCQELKGGVAALGVHTQDPVTLHRIFSTPDDSDDFEPESILHQIVIIPYYTPLVVKLAQNPDSLKDMARQLIACE